MKRLIFCPGICQIVNAAAALDRDHGQDHADQEDILVLFGRSRESVYGRAMKEMARDVWPWRDICWAEDIILWYMPTRRYAPVVREVLNNRYGRNVDEIWISMLWVDSTKLILYAFPNARVVLFEDGVVEYIGQGMACGYDRWKRLRPGQWPGAFKRECSHWNARSECMEINEICMRDLKRVDVMYSYLDGMLNMPEYLSRVPRVHVDDACLRNRYRALAEPVCASEYAQPPVARDESVLLFLPQPFAVLFLTTEDEYQLYRSAVSLILEKGYTVLWKEHPQETTPLAPRLKEEFGDHRLKLIHARQQLPVESLVAGWNLAGVVSVSSTSLLYLHGLYGYPMFTASDQLTLDRWLKRTERELARLFLNYVPGLDELPVAGSGGETTQACL